VANLLFYLMAAIAVGSALTVVLARNPLTSVIALLGSFVALATIYLLAGFQLLAAAQILVYAGAILVLFLFVIMLLNLSNAGPLEQIDLALLRKRSSGWALLVVLRGPNTGARFLLDDDEVMSGRHPDSDIFLDDVTVSRKHAVFRRTDNGFVVRDVGSLNGTYVNRELVDHAALRTGDEVQIGKFRLVFYAGQRQ
jgi:hypothetical protein